MPVIVYVAEAAATEGVPVISPVVALRVRPAGRAGETVKTIGKTPSFIVTGVNGVEFVPAVSATGVPLPVALRTGLPTRVNEEEEIS